MTANGDGDSADRNPQDAELRSLAKALRSAEEEGDAGLASTLLLSMGDLHMQLTDAASAHDAFTRALQSCPEPDTEKASCCHLGIGETHLLRGDWEQAVGCIGTAYRMRKAQHGAAHHNTAEAQSLLARALLAGGSAEDALAASEEAYRRLSELGGPNSPAALGAYETVADALRAVGDLDRALVACRQLLRGEIAAHGWTHPRVGEAQGRLADVLFSTDDRAGALKAARAAVMILTKSRGADDPLTLEAVTRVARGLAVVGELIESKELWETAWRGLERAVGADHPACASARLHYGEVLQALGDSSDALQHARAALRCLAATEGEGSRETFNAQLLVARAAAAAGARPSSARREYAEALRLSELFGHAGPPGIDLVSLAGAPVGFAPTAPLVPAPKSGVAPRPQARRPSPPSAPRSDPRPGSGTDSEKRPSPGSLPRPPCAGPQPPTSPPSVQPSARARPTAPPPYATVSPKRPQPPQRVSSAGSRGSRPVSAGVGSSDPGTCISEEENASVAAASLTPVPGRRQAEVTCSSCGKDEEPGERFGRCKRCKRVRYCSGVCQRLDWERHAPECAAFASGATDDSVVRTSADVSVSGSEGLRLSQETLRALRVSDDSTWSHSVNVSTDTWPQCVYRSTESLPQGAASAAAPTPHADRHVTPSPPPDHGATPRSGGTVLPPPVQRPPRGAAPRRYASKVSADPWPQTCILAAALHHDANAPPAPSPPYVPSGALPPISSPSAGTGTTSSPIRVSAVAQQPDSAPQRADTEQPPPVDSPPSTLPPIGPQPPGAAAADAAYRGSRRGVA